MSAAPPAATDPPAPERRVAPVELFFDLVFVLAVTRVSALLEEDHDWTGVLRALIAFVPVYWLWVGTAIRTNAVGTESAEMRATLFGVALAALFMALALPRAYDDLALLFALAYWLGRGVLGVGILRNAPLPGIPVNPVTASLAVSGPLLVAGALAGGAAQTLLWAAAAVFDLATPTLFRRRMRGMHFAADHLAERFGLFVLIALGESVVAVSASAAGETTLALSTELAVVAAFALCCGVWWVYFRFSADMIGHTLATAAVQLDITRLVLSYGHLVFVAAIIGLAGGLHGALAHPGEALGGAYAGLLCGGVALYLAGFGMTRWAMRRRISTTRLSAAALVLVLTPVAAALPSLAGLAALATVVIALCAVESWRVAHVERERRPWEPAAP